MNSDFSKHYVMLLLVALATAAAAQASDQQSGAPKLTEGVIASLGKMDNTVEIDTARVTAAIPGQDKNPVVAEIQRRGDECSATVTNRSDTTAFSISYQLESWNEDGQTRSATPFSVTLQPGSSEQHNFACPSDSPVAVRLTSGRSAE